MTQDVEDIVKGLSGAQKRALLGQSCRVKTCWVLHRKGIYRVVDSGWDITPLGLAVREALRKGESE